MRLPRRSAVLVLVALCACTRATPGVDLGPDLQLITEEQIVNSRAATAYDVVKQLRGNFLSYRGKTSLLNGESPPVPTVFLDDQEYGPLMTLKTIPAGQVSEIRLYRSWEATSKFGARQMSGVIAVTTRH